MAKYASNDRLNLKVGVSSFSENLTSLEVVGRLGVGTDSAAHDLHVEGGGYISGNVGIGTTVPEDEVTDNNTSKLSVGIVTANQYYGSGLGLTGITSATNATHIYGGGAGQLLYQAQPGVTSAFENGTTGFGLFSRGTGQPPQWLAAAPAGAIEGLLVYDEGSAVGLGTTYSGLDFRGLQVVATGGNRGGIATVTISEQPYVVLAGLSTSVIGGIASVTQLNVDAGISSFADFKITSSGVGATVGTSAGITTYYGRGTELSGIVTSITAGANIAVSGATGNVTITGLANTANITADSLVVTGITTLSTLEVSGVTTTQFLQVAGVSTFGDDILLYSSTPSIRLQDSGGSEQWSDLNFSDTDGLNLDLRLFSNTPNFNIRSFAGGSETETFFHIEGGATGSSDFGFIGIGNSQPQARLDVSGTTRTQQLIVTGVSTLGIVTGLESIGVVTAYVTDIVGTSATFTGNVTIGGTLTYQDVTNIDSVGLITARTGINVGYDYDGGTGVGITLTPAGDGSFIGIITAKDLIITDTVGIGTTNPLNALQVGFANSSFTVVSTATTTLVGIGTTNPVHTLDVRGDTNIDGNLTVNNNTVPTLAMVIALGGL